METFSGFDSVLQKSLLLSIFNNISDGIIVTDARGERLIMNPAARKITGVTADNLPAQEWSTVFGCYDADFKSMLPTEELPLVRALRGEIVIDEELIIKNQTHQNPVFLTISGHPVGEIEGDFARGGIVIFKDITRRKKMEEEMRRSHEELQQFAYVAAHDLQEPLRTITSYLGLLTDRLDGKLDEKSNKYISYATKGAQRMQTLISDLLSYSRVATRLQASKPVNMNDLMNEIIENFKTKIFETGAAIEFDTLPTIQADRSQILQVVSNLIGNALKYSKDNPHITVTAVNTGVEWLFAVKDYGIGFDMEFSERIFMIFQRLHGRTEYEGTGIGLAICRRIIARHGGKIWAESTLGAGSTFYFTIPCRGTNDD